MICSLFSQFPLQLHPESTLRQEHWLDAFAGKEGTWIRL
jgi:hypothetical protein